MCTNDALYVIMGFLGLISATLLTGVILKYKKDRELRKKVEKADG